MENNLGSGKGLHNQVKRKAEHPAGISLAQLKPNERDVAKRLIEQGALLSVPGNRFVWGAK